ncbi:ZBTB9 protein, partial [Formicarius rufipectus]|nr:ZBTB9 protein [Formicarius rufipectus]
PESGQVQISFPRHAVALLDSLNRLRLEGKFCDVAIHVGGRVFPAHKSVLAAASPFFHDKLVLQDGACLALPSAIDAGAFEGLLQLIYCGCLTVAVEALPGHLLVASGLQMWHVVDRCSEILREVEGGAGRWGGRSGEEVGVTWGGRTGEESSCVSEEVLQIRVATSASPAALSPLGPLLKAPDEEILKICVEDNEEDEEDYEDPPGTDTLRIRLEDANATTAPCNPPKIFYIKQELADAAETTNLPPTMLLPTPLTYSTTPNPTQPTSVSAFVFPQPSWKPVDLHGNEIPGRGGGLHAPVKLGVMPADGKRFGCACGKRFAVKPKRDRHIMLTLSLRPFACGTCHKRFKLKHHLTEHMKTHDGARGACQGCGRRFRLRSGLAKHRPLCPGGRWGGCWACD